MVSSYIEQSKTTQKLRRPEAFVLWEVMLALTIFSLVAVALTTALSNAVDASILLRDESQVRIELQNIMAETAATKLKPGKTDLDVGDGRIRYEREISALSAKTSRGQIL
ncbi:MAG: hypothetical protein JOY96_05190, partial [Verrucomicrobia bacterium]|nr:hypothetical protein [Verrucomicrobiota bacterium]